MEQTNNEKLSFDNHVSGSMPSVNCADYEKQDTDIYIAEKGDHDSRTSSTDVSPRKASTGLLNACTNIINDHTSGRSRPWIRSWIRFGPLSGIFCMLLAIGCIVACLGILCGSDHQSIHEWPTPPSTFLAIFTAIANLSMRYAAIQGVIICWWIRALKGSTLSKLHWDWRSGTSLRGALTTGRHMGLLGLACIFSTLVVIDGPLLQRSSTVTTAPIVGQPVSLNVSMAPELPHGFTGSWGIAGDVGWPGGHWTIAFNDTYPTPRGRAPNNIFPATDPRLDLQISTLWWNDTPLGGVFHGCSDRCHAKLIAPGLFPTSCTTHEVETTYVQYFMYSNQPNDIKTIMASPLNSQVLIIGINLLLDDREKVVVITGATNAQPGARSYESCNATMTYTTCILEAGIGEYDVVVEKDKIQIESVGEPKVIALSNNTRAVHNSTGSQYLPSTLGGIVDMMSARWEASVAYWRKDKDDAPKALSMANVATEQFQKEGDQMCPSYRDPQNDVMSSLNKLMVYFGYFAGQNILKDPDHGRMDPGLSVQTSTTGYPSGHEDVFHTDYWFFLGAALLELICVALVAPTYWGWWNIGRPISFSPLEIAKAFEAPMLSHYNSNASGRELAGATCGKFVVKYGAVSSGPDGTEQRMAFAKAADVTEPHVGEKFGE